MACLSCPGTVPLYSGVEMSSASAPAISARRRLTSAGGTSVSWSSLYGGSRSSPVKSSTSTPAGASSATARNSAVLCDPARRLPEMARTRICLCALHGRDADEQLDVVGDEQIAVREGLVPLQIEIAPVDHGFDLEADTLVAPRVGRAEIVDAPDQLDRLRDALERDLAGEPDLAVVGCLRGGRVKADLRMLLDVEELGRGQVCITVLVARVDARNLDRALQHRRLAGGVEAALELPERATDGGDAHVPNLEADVGMGGIYGVAAGGNQAGVDGCR